MSGLLCLSRSRASLLRIGQVARSMAIPKCLISTSSLKNCQQGDKITGFKEVPKESTEDGVQIESNKGNNDLKDLSSQKPMVEEVLKEIAEINKRIRENEARAQEARVQEARVQEARVQENSAKTQQNDPKKDGFFSKEVTIITTVCLIVGAVIGALGLKLQAAQKTIAEQQLKQGDAQNIIAEQQLKQGDAQNTIAEQQLKITEYKNKLDHEQSREYKILQGIDKACQPWQPQPEPLYIPRPEYEKRVLNAVLTPDKNKVNILVGPKGSGKTTILKHCLRGQPGKSMAIASTLILIFLQSFL
jgi:flagellar biosynthesis GTPase FlhF